ncbi:MAG: homocysteine S-methyltransferase family protein, partial [Oscillospiraceae bacterium]|nr:homocysteine S-methyltransferase family protein [Oscillospiraceae bacterium]
MPDKKITDAVREGNILVSDGAWGTFLHKKGLRVGECPEEWNLTRLDEVRDIARSYVAAGAKIVKTNSFGANRFRLSHFGLADKMYEINLAAARASREAAGDEVWVMASVGPTGKMLIVEDVTEGELYDAFSEQITALERGGADAVCIETMSDVDEALKAIEAAKQNTGLEIICSFTYELTARGEYR